MNNKTVRWGIIGPGRIAQQFASDMQYAKLGKCIAVASRSYDRAAKFAKEHDIALAYATYDDMLRNPDIDIVYVAVPHTFHHDVVTQVLDSGKAVLCEKPLTISTDSCSALLAKAKTKQLYLMEGMWSYFLPAIQQAKRWVDDGTIGKVKHLQCDFGSVQPKDLSDRWYNPDLAGGALYDMGCYNLAMAYLFTGKAPIGTQVICRKAETGVDKELTMVMEYEDMDVALMVSFECEFPNKTVIIGDKGYVVISDFWKSKRCDLFLNDGTVTTYEDNHEGIGFHYEIDAVSRDILNGRLQSPLVPHSYSAFIMKQMEHIISKF